MGMNRSDIEKQLLSVTRAFLTELEAERALQGMTIDASLERDLGIDSLGKVELFHRIEKAYGIQLPEGAMVEAESLRDLVNLIEKARGITTFKPHAQHYSPPLESTSLDLSSPMTLWEVLNAYAHKEPKRPHIYMQNEQGEEFIITYGQLMQEAEKVASGLYGRGIQAGETVAIMLPTSPEFFYAFCGILRIGAIPVPIYPPFRPEKIEEYAKREANILHNAQARLLITFSRAELLSNILRTFVPSLKEVMTLKNLQSSQGALPDVVHELQQIALIQYTSGSTGDPKGVTLTYDNVFANLRAIIKAIPIKPSDVVVSWLPLYHDMGLMSWLGSLYCGLPVTILSPLTFLTRPERWLWNIHYHRATLSGGPNFAYELCVKKINPRDIEGLDLSSWRFAFSGAEAVNPKTLERFIQKFSAYGFKAESFAPVYGLAETTVALTFPKEARLPRIDKIERETFETEGLAKPTTLVNEKDYIEFVACGLPLPDHEVRIVDDKGKEVSERTVGSIQFRGPSAMQGYFNNPSATQRVYRDGWWETGDYGYQADKEIFVTGRKKDIIIKAGRHLFPEEVEEIVSQLPAIRKGCVIAFGISDAVSGTEKLVVVAETYELKKQKQASIRANIIEKMAVSLGIPPDLVVLVPPKTVPKTSSGKLQRSACKEAYLEGRLTKHPLPIKAQLAKLAVMSVGRKIKDGLFFSVKGLYNVYLAIILLLTIPLLWFGVMLLPAKWAARLAKGWARNIFRLAFCPLCVEGEKHIQAVSPLIIVANHASYIDSLVLLAILPSGVLFTAKKELLHAPIISTFIKKLGYLVIDRNDVVKSLEIKTEIENEITAGKSVVIFPEGTFTYATGLRPFKMGAFAIAINTKAPLCPVAIQGSRTILRGDNKLMRPGKLTVVIGKPIYPNANDWNEAIRLHALVRSEIAKHCGEPVIDIIAAGPVQD